VISFPLLIALSCVVRKGIAFGLGAFGRDDVEQMGQTCSTDLVIHGDKTLYILFVLLKNIIFPS